MSEAKAPTLAEAIHEAISALKCAEAGDTSDCAHARAMLEEITEALAGGEIVVVPGEPTQAMLYAGTNNMRDSWNKGEWFIQGRSELADLYRAMLRAALPAGEPK